MNQKRKWLVGIAFGVLVIFSAGCLAYALTVTAITPMMVYDSGPNVKKLPDEDLSAICNKVMYYMERVWLCCSAAVLAWVSFSGYLLWRCNRASKTSNANEATNDAQRTGSLTQ